jgi:ribonuclease T2
LPPPANQANPLAYRRRRRGVTAAGLLAAVLSALAYQCSGSANRPATPTAHSTAPEHGATGTTGATPGRESATAGSGATHESANERFDFYLLALSLAPAFCADGHQARRECAALDQRSFVATPLTLHGLWPENIRSESYPRSCSGAALRISASTRDALRRWMPGMADGLADHEWNRHGRCTALDADRYFNAAIDWTAQIDAALGAAVRQAAAGRSSAATLRAAANAVRPGIGDSLVFVCKNLRQAVPGLQRRPHLIEVRACLDDDGPGGAPQTPLRCADVQRRDQGCGASFEVDAP